MLEQPGFWDDVEHSQQVMKELKNLKDTIEEFETLSNQYEDIGTLIEMAEEENDASLVVWETLLNGNGQIHFHPFRRRF